ncbi:MAG: aldehyde ferredoxin oxidoreductase N-terminal domain-containing protein, partial [Bacillota bacterium]
MGHGSLRLLKVDLSSQTVVEEDLGYERFSGYIGGWGAGVRLAWDLFKPGASALDPTSAIIICSGLVSGTPVAGSSRVAVITKYPLTGAVAMANGGLNFGDAMKRAGYDLVVVLGCSAKPVYLEMLDGKAALRDASGLWGSDISDTTEQLWGKYGPRASVMAIGPAGENGCNISLALIDNCGTVGKGGLGAVMGSKRLKAIVADGSQPVTLSNRERYDRAMENVNRRLAAYPNKDKHISMGTYWKWDHWFEEGFASCNWTRVFSKDRATEMFGPDVYMNNAKKARMACVTCPLPDREILSVKEGEHEGLVTFAGGFAGRAANYCTRCGITRYDHVLKLHDLANRLGICCNGFTSLVDFVVQMVEDGLLEAKDLGGTRPSRDFDSTLRLMEDTAVRRGLGAIIADGYPGFFRRFGDGLKKHAAQVKGLDMLYEPRLNRMGTKPFAMMVNPRGG